MCISGGRAGFEYVPKPDDKRIEHVQAGGGQGPSLSRGVDLLAPHPQQFRQHHRREIDRVEFCRSSHHRGEQYRGALNAPYRRDSCS